MTNADADAGTTPMPSPPPHRRKHPISLCCCLGEGGKDPYAALTLAATSSEAVCMVFGQILSADAAWTERAEGERVFHSDQA